MKTSTKSSLFLAGYIAGVIGLIGFAIGLSGLSLSTKKDEPEVQYYAFRYQWVVYISEGRVTGGPEKFGVVKCKGDPVKLLATKLPLRDEDKPSFATHQTDKLVEVPTFGSFTPITKEQFDIATKSKAISVNLE